MSYSNWNSSWRALTCALSSCSCVCYSVTNPFAHCGLSKLLQNNDEDIQFLADHEGIWAKEFGVDTTYDAVLLGLHSIRFSMLVDNGAVKVYNAVDDAKKGCQKSTLGC